MTIDFLRPLFLLLLLAVPLLWFFPRRIDRVVRGALRSLVFALVILALAGPVLLAPEGAPFQVFILDQSASLSASQRSRATALLTSWRQSAGDPARSAVVVLGAALPDAPNPLAKETRPVIRIAAGASQSSLAAALAAAERQIPTGTSGVITLATDGLATDRRWGPVVQRLTARGIPVATYDLGRDERDAYPVRLAADPLLRVGQTARVAVEVAGATAGLRVRLTDGEGHELAVSGPVNGTGRATVPLEFEPSAAGFLAVRAEVLPAPGADSDPANNTLTRTLAVQAPLRLLYLGDRVQSGAARLEQLLGRGFTVQDGGGLPLDAGTDLSGYDLVMVDDRPASRLPEALQARLAAAVRRDGLGLIFSGGKASFGTGGYDHTALAETLPVEFIQRTEKRDPSTALAVIIDTSGSMMGTRIELAKQVTRLAIRRLKAHDRVGIVEFYGNKHWALPLQSAANKIAIDRAIGRMQATGGTVMYPAMEEAYYGLKNVSTRYKHILIITDAGVEDADYESLVRLMTRDNVNVSTVLVGAGAHSQSLIDIASWGRGRFYSASDRYNLPEVVLKQSTTMNLPAYQQGRFPLQSRGGPGWWGEIDRAALPPLQGYVETQSRAGAEVLLEIEGAGHPALASWQYGVGRVTAFMTEPLGDGTASWKDWRDYGRWLARIASRTAGDTRPFRFDAVRQDQLVVIEAHRYADRAGLIPRATRLDAQGRVGASLAFRPLTADHFRAEIVVDPATELRLTVGAVAGPTPPAGGQFLVASPADDVAAERQVDPSATLDLAALAQATQGAFTDASGAATFKPGPRPRPDPNSLTLHELWPYAALLALLSYLADVTYRRWPRP